MHLSQRITASALTLLLLAAALSGCGKSTKPASPVNTLGMNGATAVDVAKVSDAIAANPAYVNENIYADATPMMFSATATFDGGRPSADFHHPLRWWRTIDSTDRSVDLVFGDPDSMGRPTTAIATVHRHILGQFHLVVIDSSAAADSMRRVVIKPLEDNWTRLLSLHRRHIDSDDTSSVNGDRDDWRIVGTSGVLVTSAGATEQIQSVRIQTAMLDTTITDPLAMHRLRRFECFHSLQMVHLTVTTGHNDDIVVFYRFGDRRPFTGHGDGTYTIDFLGWDFGGLSHIGVNAFANGTITSETYPYDSQAWLMPFVARDGDAQIEHR